MARSCFHQHSTHADDVNVRELRTNTRARRKRRLQMERGASLEQEEEEEEEEILLTCDTYGL